MQRGNSYWLAGIMLTPSLCQGNTNTYIVVNLPTNLEVVDGVTVVLLICWNSTKESSVRDIGNFLGPPIVTLPCNIKIFNWVVLEEGCRLKWVICELPNIVLSSLKDQSSLNIVYLLKTTHRGKARWYSLSER